VDALLGTCSLSRLRQRTSAKWRAHPADVLPAFVAEMDFDLAAPIKQAVTDALAAGDCGYAHKGALGDAYAAFAADRLGWDVDPGRVYPIPDVMTGLAEVIEAITPPGSGIVLNPPVYPPFRFRFGFYGRRIIDAPLTRDETGRYDLDPAAIEAALSQPGAAAYVLCSPHNPTGNVWSARQLEMVADLCQRHGAALLVDEIHDQRQVVIKSLETNYQEVAGVSAATILGDGRVALILDIDTIVSVSRGEIRKAG